MLKSALLFAAMLSLVYLSSYLVLSSLGRYALILDASGKRAIRWAPKGFVEFPAGPISNVQDFKWNPLLLAFYAPLYRMDAAFWHKPEQKLQF